MTYQINKAVVIGAGTMGAALAAHLANAGVIRHPARYRPKGRAGGEQGGAQQDRQRAVGSLSQGKARQPDGRQPEDAGLAWQPGR